MSNQIMLLSNSTMMYLFHQFYKTPPLGLVLYPTSHTILGLSVDAIPGYGGCGLPQFWADGTGAHAANYGYLDLGTGYTADAIEIHNSVLKAGCKYVLVSTDAAECVYKGFWYGSGANHIPDIVQDYCDFYTYLTTLPTPGYSYSQIIHYFSNPWGESGDMNGGTLYASGVTPVEVAVGGTTDAEREINGYAVANKNRAALRAQLKPALEELGVVVVDMWDYVLNGAYSTGTYSKRVSDFYVQFQGTGTVAGGTSFAKVHFNLPINDAADFIHVTKNHAEYFAIFNSLLLTALKEH